LQNLSVLKFVVTRPLSSRNVTRLHFHAQILQRARVYSRTGLMSHSQIGSQSLIFKLAHKLRDRKNNPRLLATLLPTRNLGRRRGPMATSVRPAT